MDLLHLCLTQLTLTSTYFDLNGKHYKQLHGTATGSPFRVTDGLKEPSKAFSYRGFSSIIRLSEIIIKLYIKGHEI